MDSLFWDDITSEYLNRPENKRTMLWMAAFRYIRKHPTTGQWLYFAAWPRSLAHTPCSSFREACLLAAADAPTKHATP